MRNIFSHSGYMKIDNRCGGGKLIEDDILGCRHCYATIERKKLENTLSTYAQCHSCDGPICAACGLETQLHGHGNPLHSRTMPHDQWVTRALGEAHRREQNAKIHGI